MLKGGVFMRVILKILAAPFVVVLTLTVPFMTFVFCYAAAVLYVVSGIGVLLSAALFITGQTLGGGVFLFLAFLLSPFGLSAIAEWITDRLSDLNYSLCNFITS